MVIGPLSGNAARSERSSSARAKSYSPYNANRFPMAFISLNESGEAAMKTAGRSLHNRDELSRATALSISAGSSSERLLSTVVAHASAPESGGYARLGIATTASFAAAADRMPFAESSMAADS